MPIDSIGIARPISLIDALKRDRPEKPPEPAQNEPSAPLESDPQQSPRSVRPASGSEEGGLYNRKGKLEKKGEAEEKPGPLNLSPEEEAQVQELKARDREVRAHEQAHKAAGGRYVQGGAQYEYQTGPDNRKYAVGGEVSVDAGPVPNDPQGTIEKARVVKRAALAPAQPSATDRQVAARASQMEAEARAELAEQKAEEAQLAAKAKESSAENQNNNSLVKSYGLQNSTPAAVAARSALNIYV